MLCYFPKLTAFDTFVYVVINIRKNKDVKAAIVNLLGRLHYTCYWYTPINFFQILIIVVPT